MRDSAKVRKINIVTTLANQVVTVLCGIIVPRVLLKAFGSETYGITVSIAQFLSYISLLECGIGGVARGKLYGHLTRGENKEVSSVYHATRRFFRNIGFAFIIYSLILGIVFVDIAHISSFSRGYIFVLFIAISISTLAKYMGGLADLTLLAADQKQYVNNAISIGITLCNTVAVVVLTQSDCDILWVKVGSSIVFLLRPLGYALYVYKHYRIEKHSDKKDVLPQKWTGIGQHLAYFLHRNTDVVLLTLLADPGTVAVYSVYALVINSIRNLSEAFSGGMEAAFGELIAKGDYDELRRLYHRYKAVITGVAFTLFACTGILIVPFMRLYTHEITDANYIRPIFSVVLLLAEAVSCFTLPCASFAVAANQLKQTRLGAYGEAAINIIISCVLIVWDPLIGVAIGTLAASLYKAMYYMHFASKRILKTSWINMLLRFVVAVALLLAVIIGGRMLISNISIDSYIDWIICGAGCTMIIGIPTALAIIHYMKRTRQNEKDTLCQ